MRLSPAVLSLSATRRVPFVAARKTWRVPEDSRYRRAVPKETKTVEKKKKTVPWGVPWFSTPVFLLGNHERPGLGLQLSLRELRTYLAIVAEAGEQSELCIKIENKVLYRWLGLDPKGLRETRDALVKRKLIEVAKVGKSTYQYRFKEPQNDVVLTARGGRWYPSSGIVLDDEPPLTANSWGETPATG